MPLLARFYSALCCLAGLACFCLLTLDTKAVNKSFYFSPLTDRRLQAELRTFRWSDTERFVSISETLIERDPRNALANRVLSSVYLHQNDITGFETYFFPLFKINESNTPNLVNLLVTLSDDEVVFTHFIDVIEREKPKWGELYLNGLFLNSSRPLSEYQKLYTHYPTNLNLLYGKILNRLGPTVAYAAFVDIQNINQNRSSLILDTNFNEDAYSWPFGWELNNSIAERDKGSGLSIVYFGSGTPSILKQLVKAGLGTFQIQISISGEASHTKGYYKLSVTCWQGQELESLIIDDLTLTPKTLKLNFDTTEADCNFVQVQLLGQAGNYPAPIRASINTISMTPILVPKP